MRIDTNRLLVGIDGNATNRGLIDAKGYEQRHNMYPRTYFGLFPPFPRIDRVFVAMSFDERFHRRWEEVIAPAIRSVMKKNVPLEPHRVDTSQISDSILTEILGGVSNDRCIFADVTSVGNPDGVPIRNGNVMYEVGVAHAVRLPEEVILFRSDSDRLLFDVGAIRVNTYDPDKNPNAARQEVADAIIAALREVDLKRQLAVEAAAQSLDFPSWWVLTQARALDGIEHFPIRTMRHVLANAARNAAIARLLELGALATHYRRITAEMIKGEDQGPAEQMLKYKPTEFGKAIFDYAADVMGLTSPVTLVAMEQVFGKGDPEPGAPSDLRPPDPRGR